VLTVLKKKGRARYRKGEDQTAIRKGKTKTCSANWGRMDEKGASQPAGEKLRKKRHFSERGRTEREAVGSEFLRRPKKR